MWPLFSRFIATTVISVGEPSVTNTLHISASLQAPSCRPLMQYISMSHMCQHTEHGSSCRQASQCPFGCAGR